MKEKILVVDDENEITDLVALYLENERFQVYKFYDSRKALECAQREEMDLAVLDIMMPEVDGLELCRIIRQKYTYPIIMLTAKGTEIDKINGLTLGADDYVTKPFPMSVFQKKVAALLARIRKQSGGDFYNDGNLFINFTEMTATRGGESISFTPMEYRLLKVLTKNPQIVLTRQVLLEKLWDIDGNFVDEHALTSTISRVRNKIENPDHSYIKTVYGMGYMWIGGGNK